MRKLASALVRVAGDDDVAREVGGEERVGHGLSRRVRVLLARGERPGGSVGDGVEGEPEREPRNDERDAASEAGRGVEDAGEEEDGGEAGDERELDEPEQPDSDHLAREQVARPHRRHDQLDDAVVLLLDDAADHPLAVDRKGREEEQRGDVRDQRPRRHRRPRPQGASVAVVSSGAGGRCCRSARTAVSATAASLRIDVRPEDEPVGATGAAARRSSRLRARADRLPATRPRAPPPSRRRTVVPRAGAPRRGRRAPARSRRRGRSASSRARPGARSTRRRAGA